ncbi:exportin-T-like [Dermatophagoides farinae]|uniref:exportin-T-like n=1 Tax=Dermatophagoides farinae TaxID=6954 RepID=UPI003F60CEAF
MNLEIFNKFSRIQSENALQQKEVLDYFQSLKCNPIGWKICAETLLTDSINDEMGIFFCFQVIEDYIKSRYNTDSDDERIILKHFIITMFEKNLLITNYLQNKYAHLVNTLFLIDFPQQKWPTFFKDYLGRCESRIKCELFLRVLIQINLDIADREIPKTTKEMQRNTLIKDMMRESCLMDLAQFWFNIINTYRDNCPQVVCLCLDVIGAYISWIDINLITNDSIMPVLFMLFSNVQYRCSVVECFGCILKKGMDPLAKTQLIEEFLNFELIKTTLVEIFTIHNDINVGFVEKFASLINTIGIELIEAQKKLRSRMTSVDPHDPNHRTSAIMSEAIESKFPLLCQFLSHKILTVCIRIHSFTRDYIQWLKSNVKDSTETAIMTAIVEDRTQTLISIIVDRNKMLAASYKPEDEFFTEFRKSSKVLFDNLILLKPVVTLNFICDKLVLPTFINWKSGSLTFAEIECALYYFHVIGENLNIVDDIKCLENLLQALVTSSISMFEHPITQSLYFDLIVRYEKFINSNLNQLLSQIIVSFLDNRGLRNTNIKIRSKVCKLFNKFTKSYIRSKHNSQEKQQHFIDDILKRIQDFLELDIVFDSPEDLIEQDLEHLVHSSYLMRREQIKFAYPLSASDHLQIYETVAFLIISNHHDALHKRESLKELFQKIWKKYQEYRDESQSIGLYLNQNGFTDSMAAQKTSLLEKRSIIHYHMAHLIDIISATSKSFSTVNTVKTIGVQQLFLYSFELFTKSVGQNLATVDPEAQHILQSSIRLFLHRLIVCLGEDEMIPMLPDAIQTLFLSSSEISAKSVQELIPLFNQIMPKYKHSWLFQRDILPFLDRIFSPLINLYFRLIIEANIDSEKISLQKSYYSYLHLITVHGLMPNFFDIESQLIEKIITSLIEGIVHSPDSQIQRTCCQVMANLIDIYVNDMTQVDKQNRSINQYFIRFIYDQLILACLLCTAKNCSDDYGTSQDAISLLRKLKPLLGDEQLVAFFRQEIVPKYFPSINNNPVFNNNNTNNHQSNCNDDIIAMFLTLDTKQYRKRIRHTFQQFKK